MNKIAKGLATTTFLLLLVATIAEVASAATLTATPDNSNIFNATGTGFTANSNVTLQLWNGSTTLIYTFPNATTDSSGNFSAILIVPTSIPNATYTLTATTGTVSQSVSQTTPDLTGPTGATGATGATGPTGATGATGQAASNILAYGAIIISVMALVAAAIAARYTPTVVTKRTDH